MSSAVLAGYSYFFQSSAREAANASEYDGTYCAGSTFLYASMSTLLVAFYGVNLRPKPADYNIVVPAQTHWFARGNSQNQPNSNCTIDSILATSNLILVSSHL